MGQEPLSFETSDLDEGSGGSRSETQPAPRKHHPDLQDLTYRSMREVEPFGAVLVGVTEVIDQPWDVIANLKVQAGASHLRVGSSIGRAGWLAVRRRKYSSSRSRKGAYSGTMKV